MSLRPKVKTERETPRQAQARYYCTVLVDVRNAGMAPPHHTNFPFSATFTAEASITVAHLHPSGFALLAPISPLSVEAS